MAKSPKGEVLNNPDDDANTGSNSFPPSSGEAAKDATHQATDSKESAAGETALEENETNGKQETTTDECKVEEFSQEQLFNEIQAEKAVWQDKYIRLHAEWDTYRRRTAEQRQEEKARATEKLIEGLLPVIDDFERTIDYAQKNGETGLLGGVEAVHNKLIGVLKKDGVEVLDPVGEAFDALNAQAVSTIENADVPDETVSEVYQKGYKMGNKVLRPAMVTVSVGGPKREVPQDEEESK